VGLERRPELALERLKHLATIETVSAQGRGSCRITYKVTAGTNPTRENATRVSSPGAQHSSCTAGLPTCRGYVVRPSQAWACFGPHGHSQVGRPRSIVPGSTILEPFGNRRMNQPHKIIPALPSPRVTVIGTRTDIRSRPRPPGDAPQTTNSRAHVKYRPCHPRAADGGLPARSFGIPPVRRERVLRGVPG